MGRFLAILVIVIGAYLAWKHNGATVTNSARTDGGAAELAQLAASVRQDEIVMYSTTECTYCAQAKSWLNQYGFSFTECNMSISPECERQFRAYGATGTPYLVVRGHHMKDGFDSDEFISLLKKS